MPAVLIWWDLEDDPEGNVNHIAEHGVTQEEVEEVLRNPTDRDKSRTTGYPVVFGVTSSGRHIIVVFEEIDADTVYPITAFEVPPRNPR